MPSASLNFPGTVPTCHIRQEVLGRGVASSESSEIESNMKRCRLFLLRCLPRRPHNHTQLCFSPSVNDSPRKSALHKVRFADNAPTQALLRNNHRIDVKITFWNIYNWFHRKWSACLTLATANDRNFTMHWSHISLPFRRCTTQKTAFNFSRRRTGGCGWLSNETASQNCVMFALAQHVLLSRSSHRRSPTLRRSTRSEKRRRWKKWRKLFSTHIALHTERALRSCYQVSCRCVKDRKELQPMIKHPRLIVKRSDNNRAELESWRIYFYVLVSVLSVAKLSPSTPTMTVDVSSFITTDSIW